MGPSESERGGGSEGLQKTSEIRGFKIGLVNFVDLKSKFQQQNPVFIQAEW